MRSRNRSNDPNPKLCWSRNQLRCVESLLGFWISSPYGRDCGSALESQIFWVKRRIVCITEVMPRWVLGFLWGLLKRHNKILSFGCFSWFPASELRQKNHEMGLVCDNLWFAIPANGVCRFLFMPRRWKSHKTLSTSLVSKKICRAWEKDVLAKQKPIRPLDRVTMSGKVWTLKSREPYRAKGNWGWDWWD